MKKYVITFFAVLFIAAVIVPVSVLADTTSITTGTNGTPIDISTLAYNTTLSIETTELVELTGIGYVTVVCSQGANVELIDCDITSSDGSALSFTGTGNTLILSGVEVSTLKTNGQAPAIHVGEGTALAIYGTGALNATGTHACAGIGGYYEEAAGTIDIYGGTITAAGGEFQEFGTAHIYGGAGIGGGGGAGGGNITAIGAPTGTNGHVCAAGIGASGASDAVIVINGGTVNATGGYFAAGIGHGGLHSLLFTQQRQSSGSITINGGTVNATGGYGGSAIGSGYNEHAGTIHIHGDATVNATSGRYGAGIGSGWYGYGAVIDISNGTGVVTTIPDYYGGAGIGSGQFGSYSSINISNKTVIAEGGRLGAGIGGGNGGYCGSITISNNSIVTASNNSFEAAGIGSGENGLGTLNISLSQSNITASSDSGGAAIGSGQSSQANVNITIHSGTINATGGSTGAAIGSGNLAWAPNNITIYNGTINANGGNYGGAAIGGGSSSDGGNITIHNGTITAVGGGRNGTGEGAGIGGGSGANAGLITINGGLIHATGAPSAPGIGSGHGGEVTAPEDVASVILSGGEIYSRSGTGPGSYTMDIGNSNSGEGCTVEINGTAAVFYDFAITAPTTTHTLLQGESVANNTAYTFTNFPDSWNGANVSGYAKELTITFNENYESCPPSVEQTVYCPQKIVQPADPVRLNHEFTGWFTDSECTALNQWDFENDVPENNLTLYANWDMTTASITSGTNGTPYNISSLPSDVVLTIDTTELVELTGSSDIEISCASGVNIELIDVTISSAAGALKFAGGVNTLTVTGTNSLTSAAKYAGVEVSSEVTSLTIDGTGTLNATSGYRASAIGGSEGQDSGEIVINGGTINAYGSSSGIGGGYTLDGYGSEGYGGTSGDITINGGVIYAESSSDGAGIGGGSSPSSSYGHCNNITINGGIVTALSTYQGNGIGSGAGDILGTISITGGQVNATGGQYGAGIGGRKSATSLISISGGLVVAEGGSGSAGIGGQSMAHGGDIVITGGEVYAKGDTDNDSSYIEDIGCGDWSGISSLEISGSAAVFLWHNKTASLTTTFTNVSSETVTEGSAYGFNNFPESWEGDTAYGYVIPVTVSFENCNEPDQNTYATLTVTQPADPERSGSIFLGWMETSQYPDGEFYDFDTVLTDDVTIYAVWETPSDVTEDGVVDLLDISACAQEYGSTGFEGREDVNQDGIVNLYDLVEIAGNLTTY